MKDYRLTPSDLRQFTGTEHWYRHPIGSHVLYTDGVRYVAEEGGGYWLLDAIAIAQQFEARVTAEPFQVWTLTVRKDQSASLVCDDGNGKEVYRQELDYTDFPLAEVTFYFTDGVLLLPGEY